MHVKAYVCECRSLAERQCHRERAYKNKLTAAAGPGRGAGVRKARSGEPGTSSPTHEMAGDPAEPEITASPPRPAPRSRLSKTSIAIPLAAGSGKHQRVPADYRP